jgi:hypothetical protein
MSAREWKPDAHADLLELAALCQQLPDEAARQRADQLLERLVLAEVERTERATKRLQRIVAARTLPAAQRARELAQVAEQMLGRPDLSATKNRDRLARATGMPKSRIRAYQEVLRQFTPKAGLVTTKRRVAEAMAAVGGARVREGRAPRPRDYLREQS